MSPGPIGGFPPPRHKSPVLGDTTAPPAASTVGATQGKAVQQLGALHPIDLDAFVRARAKQPYAESLPPSLKALLAPATASRAGETTGAHEVLQRTVGELSSIFADGLVTEAELAAVGRAENGIRALLALRDDGALQMLPRDARQRLELLLFEPLDQLQGALRGHVAEVMTQVDARDRDALLARLQDPKVESFRQVEPGDAPASMRRYAVGDLVAVPRSDSSVSLGVVTGLDPDGLRVEVGAGAGGTSVGLRKLSQADLDRASPLKIGDYLEVEGKQIWVTGLKDGQLALTIKDGSGVRAIADTAEAARLARLIGTAATGPAPTPVKAQELLRAGGAETVKPEAFTASTAKGALFTDRGIGYADYNEDAAVLGALAGKKGELVFVGAFDQAGGMGKTGKVGEASEIAAKAFSEAAQRAAKGEDAEQALRAAIAKGHAAVNALGVGAATTLSGALIEGGQALVVNVGDSGVLHFGKDGKLKNQTASHNLNDLMYRKTGDPNAMLAHANGITSCLGGDEAPTVDFYRWKVEPGDTLVVISDGVGDANLGAQKKALKDGKPWTRHNGDVTSEAIGGMVKAGGAPEAIAQSIVGYARSQCERGDGKRDNTTAVVLRVGG